MAHGFHRAGAAAEGVGDLGRLVASAKMLAEVQIDRDLNWRPYLVVEKTSYGTDTQDGADVVFRVNEDQEGTIWFAQSGGSRRSGRRGGRRDPLDGYGRGRGSAASTREMA